MAFWSFREFIDLDDSVPQASRQGGTPGKLFGPEFTVFADSEISKWDNSGACEGVCACLLPVCDISQSAHHRT